MSNDPKETFEDRLITELIDRLSDNVTPAVAGAGEEATGASEVLVREYLESFGLLAYDLEPEMPSAGAKERLMRAIESEVAEESHSDEARQEKLAAVVPITKPAKLRWALPLAAGLALALLGVSVWQEFMLKNQNSTIADLSDRLSDANVQATAMAEYQDGLRAAQNKLALVTSRGVEVCTLNPSDLETAPPDARGTLFVAADHQSWYMRLDGLVPCPLGRKHQIWFVQGDGTAVSAGVFEVEEGVEIELTSETMPPDTIAVMITLEPATGSSEPTGPSVLYGDEVMRIL